MKKGGEQFEEKRRTEGGKVEDRRRKRGGK